MSSYIIKTITREQLDEIIAWAAAEGWNPGLHDADCFYQADPSGFLVGFLEGEAIASISVVKYGTGFGFLGFYIVKPEFRGRGYGLKIWQAGLATLEGRTIGLDGVVDQQSNYLKSGFELAYRNIRYEGISHGTELPMTTANLVPLSSLPMADILGYDKPFFRAIAVSFCVAGSRSQTVMDWVFCITTNLLAMVCCAAAIRDSKWALYLLILPNLLQPSLML